MSVLAAPVPLFTVIVFAVIAALPWGGGDTARAFLLLLPLASVHFWSLKRPTLMPAAGIFGSGLLMDLLTQGPIGFFAFVALAVGFISRYLLQRALRSSILGRYLLFVVAVCCASALIWTIASLYIMAPLPLMSHVYATLLAVAIYPLLSALLSGIDVLLWTQHQRQLFGGAP